MQQIEDTVFILNAIATRVSSCMNAIKHAIEAGLPPMVKLEDKPPTPNQVLVTATVTLILIQASAFLDEWNTQFLYLRKCGIEPALVTKVESIVQPALAILHSYDGLKDYRNRFLAHNLRQRVDDLVTKKATYQNAFRNNLVTSSSIPLSIHECFLVCECISVIAEVVSNEFRPFYKTPAQFIRDHNDVTKVRAGLSGEECQRRTANMVESVRANLLSVDA
jgi:hypothetical protein